MNEPDPHAELKAAWNADKRIRLAKRQGDHHWRRKSGDARPCTFEWSLPPSEYEIHPDDVNSKTPRTDEECGGPPKSGDDTWPSMYVAADFARQLETELNEARAELAETVKSMVSS